MTPLTKILRTPLVKYPMLGPATELADHSGVGRSEKLDGGGSAGGEDVEIAADLSAPAADRAGGVRRPLWTTHDAPRLAGGDCRAASATAICCFNRISAASREELPGTANVRTRPPRLIWSRCGRPGRRSVRPGVYRQLARARDRWMLASNVAHSQFTPLLPV